MQPDFISEAKKSNQCDFSGPFNNAQWRKGSCVFLLKTVIEAQTMLTNTNKCNQFDFAVEALSFWKQLLKPTLEFAQFSPQLAKSGKHSEMHIPCPL